MLSREQLASFADALPPLAPPRFPRTPEQSSALEAALGAIDRICHAGEDHDAGQEAGATLTEQLAAAEARREALGPAVDKAMAAQKALAAAGLELSVQGGRLVVSRRRSMAPPGRRQAGRRGMTAPEDFLTLWRTAAPGDLLADRELPARLLAFLAARLDPHSGREKRLLDRVLRDGWAPAEGFRLARLLSPVLRGVPSDFTMSWVLWSALRGHDAAIMALAQCLLQRAGEARAADNAIQNDDPAAAASQAEALEQLALAWLRRVQHSVLGDFHHWLRALDLNGDDDEEVAERLDEGAAPAAGPAGAAPSLQVLKLTSYQKAFEPIGEEYAALAEPLPLKGGEVRPELLRPALELGLPHMAEAIDCIVRDLELRRRAGVPWARFRPLLLVGPPGTGKTRLARSLARLLGTGHGEMGVGGVSDNRLLEGTARGWKDAQPCWPLLVMRSSSCANPVLLVDEIDKARASHNGDVMATLLGMLESETARTWFDACLLAPADLSQISWILTANTTATLPRPLLSRLRVVHVGHPAPEAFDRVLESLLRDLAAELSVRCEDLPELPREVVDAMRDGFARHSGIRELKRALEAALARAEPAPRRLN